MKNYENIQVIERPDSKNSHVVYLETNFRSVKPVLRQDLLMHRVAVLDRFKKEVYRSWNQPVIEDIKKVLAKVRQAQKTSPQDVSAVACFELEMLLKDLSAA